MTRCRCCSVVKIPPGSHNGWLGTGLGAGFGPITRGQRACLLIFLFSPGILSAAHKLPAGLPGLIERSGVHLKGGLAAGPPAMKPVPLELIGLSFTLLGGLGWKIGADSIRDGNHGNCGTVGDRASSVIMVL